MMPLAVIFDRDLTLTAVDHPAMAAFATRLAGLAPRLALPALIAAWEGWPGPWPRSESEEQAFWEGLCADLTARGLVEASGTAVLAAELAVSYPRIFRAYPDAAPTLRALKAAGLRLAVLTNFELPSVHRTLAHAGLDPGWFDHALSAPALGWPKPDPRAFVAAADTLGLPLTACCLVDDLVENVVAARSIGMRAYQIDRSLPAPTADGRIGSLLDLIGLLTSSDAGPEPRPHSPNCYDMPT